MSAALFQELSAAQSARAMKAVLLDYAEEQGLDSINDLPFKHLGGIPNNRGPVEVMVSTKNALYEKVMNGYDAVIDLYQRRSLFKTNPQNAAQALEEISAQAAAIPTVPGVYVITSKADTARGSVGQPKKRANVLVLDEGAGILPKAFESTILSLNGSNKIANPLMAGSYGMGGSAIYRDTEYALIYSVSEQDPSTAAFTVIYRRFDAQMRFPSYVYLTDGNGEILTFNVSDLPSRDVLAPNDIDKDTILEVGHKIILPRHGTGVKIFELEGLSSVKTNYEFFRDRGFGMNMPVKYRHGIPVQSDDDDEEGRGSTRRFYDIIGMRHSLNDPRKRGSYPIRHHISCVPILVVNGMPQATLECWAITRSDTKKITDNDKKNRETPVEATLGKDRATSPFYITLNGMAQDNLPSYVLLKKAGLNFISGNIIIEINCDQMDPQVRGQFFTSSRERIHRDWEERVKDDIIKFLTMEAQDDLGVFDSEMKDKLLANAEKDSSVNDGLSLFAKVMKTSVAGAIFGRFGAPLSEVASSKQREEVSLDSDHSGGGKPNRLGPNRIPTIIEVTKRTIKRGEAQWITVRTDAFDDWDDAISIDLPAFLSHVTNGRIPLRHGRVSFSVLCDPDVMLDTEGSIRVTLDRSRESLAPIQDETNVVVIKPAQRTQTKEAERTKERQRNALPEFDIVPVKPFEAGWEQMRASNLQPKDVAFNYVEQPGGKITLFYNIDFPALRQSVDELGRKKSSQSIIRTLTNDYLLNLRLLTIAEIDSKHDMNEEGALERLHKSRADAVKASTLMFILLIERFQNGPDTDSTEMTAAA